MFFRVTVFPVDHKIILWPGGAECRKCIAFSRYRNGCGHPDATCRFVCSGDQRHSSIRQLIASEHWLAMTEEAEAGAAEVTDDKVRLDATFTLE